MALKRYSIKPNQAFDAASNSIIAASSGLFATTTRAAPAACNGAAIGADKQ
jgi:hypothetical protein